MLWLKECSRCHGDLYESWDVDGINISCIQCGYHPAPAEAEAIRHGRVMISPTVPVESLDGLCSPVHSSPAGTG